MNPLDKIKEQTSESRGLLERAMSYVPLYGGYKEKNVRRNVDREVRMFVVRALDGVKIDLGNIHRDVIDSGNMKRAINIERLRIKVDTHSTRIEKAVNGYSGIWSTMKKGDDELDGVMEWDVKLLEDADNLKKLSDVLSNDADIDASIKDIENKVDELLEMFMERDAVLKGLVGDE